MIPDLLCGMLVCLLAFTPIQVPAASPQPKSVPAPIRVPSVKERMELPIFSIYRRYGSASVRIPRTPSVVIAVWSDGYCILSGDDFKGGPPPYKNGWLGNNALLDFKKRLRSFTPPAIWGPTMPDASSIVIVIHDESRSTCFALESSHELYSRQKISPLYDNFLHTWGELRRLAKSVHCDSLSSKEEFAFEFRMCAPFDAPALLLEHVGAGKKAIANVLLYSSDSGSSRAMIREPERLQLAKKEAVKEDIIPSLYQFVKDLPAPQENVLGTTRLTFFFSTSDAEIVVDPGAMKNLRKEWAEAAPLPPSVVEYFERAGINQK